MADDRFTSPRGLDGEPIQQPSVGVRRRAILVVLVGAVIGTLVIARMHRWLPALEDWITSEPTRSVERVRILMLVMAAFVDLPLVLAGIYIWRLGLRTIETERFPPPGMSVTRPTPILTGEAAKRRGRAAQTLALILFSAGAVIVALLLWMSMRLQA